MTDRRPLTFVGGKLSELPVGDTIASSFISVLSDRLVGRNTAGEGPAEEITVGGGIEFTGSGGIRRSALTGDVTASAGSNATTIAANVVSNAKLRDSAAVSVIGRSANSAGDPADIVAGANDRLLARVSNAVSFTQLTPGMFPATLLDTDDTLAADSDVRIPSQQAIKKYVDDRVGDKPAFRVGKSGTQDLSTSYQQLTYDVEVFDIGGGFASSAWTPGVNGIVVLTAACGITTNSGSITPSIQIRKNGDVIAEAGTFGNGSCMASVSAVDQCVDTDVYTIYAKSVTSGGTPARIQVDGTQFSGAVLSTS